MSARKVSWAFIAMMELQCTQLVDFRGQPFVKWVGKLIPVFINIYQLRATACVSQKRSAMAVISLAGTRQWATTKNCAYVHQDNSTRSEMKDCPSY